jgi:multidrug efflux pump subunit AcrA (membrane-fusion protein)
MMPAFRWIFALLIGVALLAACETVEGGRKPGTPVPRPVAPAPPVTPTATAPGSSYPYPSP